MPNNIKMLPLSFNSCYPQTHLFTTDWAPKDSAFPSAVCFKCCSQDDFSSATLHISDYMINELHWLPILARVKSQQGLAPKYLCELMSKPPSARSSRPARSADRCDLL